MGPVDREGQVQHRVDLPHPAGSAVRPARARLAQAPEARLLQRGVAHRGADQAADRGAVSEAEAEAEAPPRICRRTS